MTGTIAEISSASHTAEQILRLLVAGDGRRLEDVIEKVLSSPAAWLADSLERERWEVLQAVAGEPGFTHSEICLALLRHLAGGSSGEQNRPRSAQKRVLQ